MSLYVITMIIIMYTNTESLIKGPVSAALARVTNLDVYVQKAALHNLECEAHLHSGADAVEETLLRVSIHAREVAVDVWT